MVEAKEEEAAAEPEAPKEDPQQKLLETLERLNKTLDSMKS
jgi:hypothetical protein